jgi:hypothetical protein
MQSNEFTYGPWYRLSQQQGKIDFIKDDGLVPWEYGGYTFLDAAADAMVTNYPTESRIEETGEVLVPGVPDKEIGDALIAGGPIVTSIGISAGEGGVTTTYTCRTYTPVFGRFSDQNADRIRKFGLSANRVNRALKAGIRDSLLSNQSHVKRNAYFMERTSSMVALGSPHAALVGHVIEDTRTSGRYVPMVSLQKYGESVGNIRTDNDDIYQASAAAGLETLFRPFLSVGSEVKTLPSLRNPNNAISGATVKLSTINPFQQDKNDFEWVTHGDSTYFGLHARKMQATGIYGPMKGIAHRGPMMLTGWGYDWKNDEVPSASDYNGVNLNGVSPTGYNFKLDCRTWMTGPIALRWNKWKAYWDFPCIVKGTLTQDLLPGSGVDINMDIFGETVDTIKVYNYFSSTIDVNTKVIAAFDPNEDRFYVTAADCVEE